MRPFVTANFALTWDGKVSTRKRTPSDFSSPEDKRRFLEIRATGDAVLVGRATVAADNMSMGLSDAGLRAARVARGQSEYPLRIVVTNSGELGPKLKIFAHDFSPIHIFTSRHVADRTLRRLEKRATVHRHGDTVDLAAMLAELHDACGVRRVVCEGGPTLFRAMLAADLVDEFHLTLCPRIFGGKDAPSLTGPPDGFLPKSTQCRLAAMEVLGDECFLRYEVVR